MLAPTDLKRDDDVDDDDDSHQTLTCSAMLSPACQRAVQLQLWCSCSLTIRGQGKGATSVAASRRAAMTAYDLMINTLGSGVVLLRAVSP